MKPIPRAKPAVLPPALLALSVLLAAAGCGKDDIAGTTTETVTGKTTGLIHLSDGNPAVGARVRVFPVGYRPAQDSGSSLTFRTVTDARGRYILDSLAPGEYNILSELDGKSAIQDSTFLSGSARALASDTLDEPGIVCGFVALQPGDLLPTTIVQILGTNAFVNVDEDGFFQLPKLAPGTYRAAVSTTLPDYTTLYAGIEVSAGRKDTLADTLRPFFNGIPQVTGLKASYDTLSGKVTLDWRGVNFRNRDGYLIFRDVAGSPDRSTVAVAAVRDTVYTDFIYPDWPMNVFQGLDPVREFEYRVAIRDNFGRPGRTFGSLFVSAPSPYFVTTQSSLEALGLAAGRASLHDTVLIVFGFNNPTRPIRKLTWTVQGQNVPSREVLPVALYGKDTLRIVCAGAPGRRTVLVKTTDDGGVVVEREISFDMVLDLPALTLTGKKVAVPGSEYTLTAQAADGFGSVTTLEWDIGMTGTFIRASGRDTTFTLQGQKQMGYACVARVTDDDGLSVLDTFRVDLVPWKKAGPMPYRSSGAAMTTLNGKLYLIGGFRVDQWGNRWADKSLVYDPSTDVWSELEGPLYKADPWAVAAESSLFLITRSWDGEVFEFSPITGIWTSRANMPRPKIDIQPVFMEGKIRVLGGSYPRTLGPEYKNVNEVYDPVKNEWLMEPNKYVLGGFLAAVTLGEKAYIVNNDRGGSRYSLMSLTPGSQTLAPLPETEVFPGSRNQMTASPFLAEAGGKLYLAGGSTFQNGSPANSQRMQVYDPAAGTWSEGWPLLSPGQPYYFGAAGGKLIRIGAVGDGAGILEQGLLVETLDITE